MFVAPAGYQPVYSPSVPYTGPINGGMRDGMSIYIQGSIRDSTDNFLVNLLCGQSTEGSDIAMHFNPRFSGWDKVVFNSRQDGSWQSEDSTRDMPFSLGQPFEMVILAGPQGYQIKVNGKDFYTFPHRLPVERVCAINIAGDVSVQTINIIGGRPAGGMGGGGMGGGCMPPGGGMGGGMGGYPGGGMGGGMGGYPGGSMGGGMGGGYPGGPGGGGGNGYPGSNQGGGGNGYPGSNLPVMGGQPVYNPTVPYSQMIPGGMSSKRTLIIRGMVPFGADRMCINFVASSTRDIAFHMNPRVRDGVVVRNSMVGGGWGQEERETGFCPFAEGQYFDMSIRCGNQRFKVFVNGQHLFDFFHRLQPFTQVDTLEIDGDITISYIHF